MSTTTQNISQVFTEVVSSQPTWQDIEKAIIDILRAGIYYRKPKDKGFMSWYKKQLGELRQSEDQETHVYEKALAMFPNEEIYKQTMELRSEHYKKEPKIRQTIEKYHILCYNLVKDSFINAEEIEEELNEWIND